MRRSDKEVTVKEELDTILSQGIVCHLALSEQSVPYLIAMNYGYEWTDKGLVFYFHCANEGKKLDIIQLNPIAAFMVDTGHELVTGEKACDWGMKFMSVCGSGTMEIISDPAEKKYGLDRLMKHFANHEPHEYHPQALSRTIVLRLHVIEITGKKSGYS